jgi:hypothetical protein
MLPSVESSQPGVKIGMFFSAAARTRRILGIDLIVLLEHAGADEFVEELERQFALAAGVGLFPEVDDVLFDPADRFAFGNACIRDAVQVLIEELPFVGRRQVAIVRNADVVIVRDQIKNVFFEVVRRTRHGVDFVLANHVGQREPDLGRTHRAAHREEHFFALAQVLAPALGRVNNGRGIEVPVVVLEERRNRSVGHGKLLKEMRKYGRQPTDGHR